MKRKEEGGRRVKGFKNSGSPNRPLVSVITAVYNGQQHLRQCIQSVKEQTYPHVEHIIVDGGSNDGTVEILKEQDDAIDLWVSEPDKGIYDAWNKGVALASGEWIAFLGCDDVYLPNSIEEYISYIASEGGAEFDFVSSKVALTNQSLKTIRVVGQPWQWPRFQRFMNVAHVGSLHNRRIFTQYGLFDTRFRIVADYELLLRPRGSLRAGYLDLVTVKMRVGGISQIGTKVHQEQMRAKVLTGGRNRFVAYFEKWLAFGKHTVKMAWQKRYE